MGCNWNRNEVTTPKFPPPPRTAQKRSACSWALAVTKLRSARGAYQSSRYRPLLPARSRHQWDEAACHESEKPVPGPLSLPKRRWDVVVPTCLFSLSVLFSKLRLQRSPSRPYAQVDDDAR